MNERWILVDQGTGLHVGWYFWLRVLDEVNRSGRYGTPFALLLLTAEPEHDSRRALEEAVSAVPLAIRSTDLGGLIGQGRIGVLLTHQEPDPAKIAAARILEKLGVACRGVRWTDRLLCYPDDGAEISNLLTTGESEHRAGDIRVDLELPA